MQNINIIGKQSRGDVQVSLPCTTTKNTNPRHPLYVSRQEARGLAVKEVREAINLAKTTSKRKRNRKLLRTNKHKPKSNFEQDLRSKSTHHNYADLHDLKFANLSIQEDDVVLSSQFDGYVSQIGLDDQIALSLAESNASFSKSICSFFRPANRIYNTLKYSSQYAYDHFNSDYVYNPALLFTLKQRPMEVRLLGEIPELRGYRPKFDERRKPPLVEIDSFGVREFLDGLTKTFNATVPTKRLQINDELCSKIELMIALYFNLSECTTLRQLAGALTLFTKSFYKGSLCVSLAGYTLELFGYVSQAETEGAEPPVEQKLPVDWMDLVRNIRTNWMYVKNNKFFGHLSKLMGLVVVSGLASSTDLTFDLNGYKICEPDLEVIHGKAFDVFDACLQTATYFVETFMACQKMKSLRPLFFDNPEIMSLDDEFATCLSNWEQFKMGNLKDEIMTEEKFAQNLENVGDKLRHLILNTTGFEKNILSQKYTRIVSVINDYTTAKINSGIREAPFVLEIFGPSSHGKTTFGMQITDFLLGCKSESMDVKYRGSVISGDKYMSNWTSNKTVLTIDDFGNDKVSAAGVPPTRIILDVCNNQPMYANKAEVEAKGKVIVAPKIVILNTNIKNLNAGLHSHCPYSIQRRMHYIITVVARPEFRLTNGVSATLDQNKVLEAKLAQGSSFRYNDCWLFTLEQAREPTAMDKVADYVPVWANIRNFNGEVKNVRMVDVDFKTLANFLIVEYVKHSAIQKAVVLNASVPPVQEKCSHPGCLQFVSTCFEHIQVCLPTVVDPPDPKPPDPIDDDPNIVDDDMPSLEPSAYVSAMDWESTHTSDPFMQIDDVAPLCVPIVYHINPVQISTSVHIDNVELHFPPQIDQFDDADSLSMNCNEEYQSQAVGDFLASRVVKVGTMLTTGLLSSADKLETNIGNALVLGARAWLTTWDWMKIVPSHWILNNNSVGLLYACNYEELNRRYVKQSLYNWVRYIIPPICARVFWARFPVLQVLIGTATVGSIQQFRMHNTIYQHFRSEVVLRNTISPTLAYLRDRYLDQALKAGGLLATLIILQKAYKMVVNTQESQGNLSPTCEADIVERDSEINVWAGVVRRPLPQNVNARTYSVDDACNIIDTNLVCCTCSRESITATVNGLFITSNAILLPSHVFIRGDEDMRFVCNKVNASEVGGNFRIVVSKSSSIVLPGTDLLLAFVTSGGSMKDITHLFVDEGYPECYVRMLWRSPEGNLLESATGSVKGSAKYSKTCSAFNRNFNRCLNFPGYNYTLNVNTFDGMCGGVVLCDSRPTILGLHLGGMPNGPKGCAGSVRLSDLKNCLTELAKLPAVLMTGKAGHFETQMMGYTMNFANSLSYKSPIKYLPPSSSLQYHGSDGVTSTFRTSVIDTVISKHVEAICGFENCFRPPFMKRKWAPWQDCLQHMSSPGCDFPPHLIQLAVEDYKRPLLEIFKSPLWNHIKPLTDTENMSGVPGKRFLDAIKSATSMGYPINKSKANFMEDLEPFGPYQHPKTFIPTVWDEIKRCEDLYKQGVRAYPIAKGQIKDEIHSKPKCRIFFVNPVALTFLLRKYFLPVMRVMQMYSLISECAVGINCHGPEWQQLHDFIRTHGVDRVIGGDYSNYDQHLPAQVLLAGMHCLISFAEVCNYSEEDLTVMRAMAGDVIYPFIVMNGDLISTTEGSHISGNSLTTVLNGICGSLNVRCAFFNKFPPRHNEKPMDFRAVVSFITYGDDNIGSVKKGIEFSIVDISNFLKLYDQIYTMPNKSVELTEFLELDEIEFLKRQSVYHEALGHHIGALSEKSCFKMLHKHMWDSKVHTKQEAAALNIDTALSEWFNHGEKIYEMRREQMQRVAEAADVTIYCKSLDITYEARAENWKDLYINKTQLVPADLGMSEDEKCPFHYPVWS